MNLMCIVTTKPDVVNHGATDNGFTLFSDNTKNSHNLLLMLVVAAIFSPAPAFAKATPICLPRITLHIASDIVAGNCCFLLEAPLQYSLEISKAIRTGQVYAISETDTTALCIVDPIACASD
jgi:hypothetical protein